jgi:Helix-turn-helix
MRSALFDLTRSDLPFGEALTALVREVEDDAFLSSRGLKIRTFAEMLDGVSASTLAAAVSGTTTPSRALLLECARYLRVRPEYFREYRAALPQAA